MTTAAEILALVRSKRSFAGAVLGQFELAGADLAGLVAPRAQLVQLGGNQRAAVFLVEHGAVGVEKNIGAAIFQIAHHPRQVLHQHRLTDAVQNRPMQIRNLIDD